MQGQVRIKCSMCNRLLTVPISFDTADAAEQLGFRIQKLLLNHRTLCRYYAFERKSLFLSQG